MMKSCFVTGITGFVGLNFIEELLRSKIFGEIFFFVRKGTKRQDHLLSLLESYSTFSSISTIEVLTGDIRDLKALKHAIPLECDCVFHIAADIDQRNTRCKIQDEVNIEGTVNVIEACISKSVKRLVHISTQAVYLGEGMNCIKKAMTINEKSEKLAKNGKSNYALSKYKAELKIREGIKNGLDAVILQPAFVIGEFDYLDSSMTKFIKDIRNMNVQGITNGRFCFTDAKALAKAMLLAYEKGKCGEEYLIGGVNARFREVSEIVTDFYEREEEKMQNYYMLYALGLGAEIYCGVRNLVCSCFKEKISPEFNRELVKFLHTKIKIDDTKARKELEYESPNLKDTIWRILKWMDENLYEEEEKEK